jgi:hypothetical protein
VIGWLGPRTGPAPAPAGAARLAAAPGPLFGTPDVIRRSAPRWGTRFLGAAALALLAAAGLAGTNHAHALVTRVHPPLAMEIARLSPQAPFIDPTLVSITMTASWQTIPRVVPLEQLLRDRTVWQLMHFNDWDRLPADIRDRGLMRMIALYRHVLSGPAVWRRMSVHEWDAVPQPIRAMAYLRMVWHWADARQVGAEFWIEPRRAAETIGAIVMAESWFEHRAFNENEWGNRDLGLAQCSDYCREQLARMAAAGDVDFTFSEEELLNPWHGTLVATVWFERELRNAAGDLDVAVRAYHRGMTHAFDEKGDSYLANVDRKRRRYIRNEDAPPAWRFIARQVLAG